MIRRLTNHPHFWTVLAGIIITLYIVAGFIAVTVHTIERTWL